MNTRATLRVEVIDTLSGMEALREAWQALERSNGDPHAVFQSYTWCQPFAASWFGGTSLRPLILTVWQADDLVALLPLQTSGKTTRRVEPFGAPHTQVVDVLTSNDDAITLLLQALLERTPLDVVELGPMVENGPLHRSLAALGQMTHPHPADVLSAFDCTTFDDPESYIAGLSKNRRRDYRRKVGRLEDIGPVRLRRLQPDDADFRAILSAGLAMKRDWLRRTGTLSFALFDRRTDKFFQAMKQSAGGATMLEVEALEAGDTLLAVALNLVGHGQRACYLSAYDEVHHVNSPGTLTHQLAIQNSITDGLNTYSLLGYPTEFKRVWTNTQVPLVGWTAGLSLRGRLWLRLWAKGARAPVKSAIQRMSGRLARWRGRG